MSISLPNKALFSLCCFLVLWGLPNHTFAQKKGLDANIKATLRFEIFNEDNSPIPHPFINDIAVDKDNSVWVATGGGLVHFSASDTTIYTPQNSPLNDYGIKSLALGKGGNKYIGTYGQGLFKLDPTGKFQNLSLARYSHINQKQTIISIAEDHSGTIWFGTEEMGLFKTNQQFDFVENIEKTAFSRVFKIIVDEKNTKWIATERGLYTLNAEKETLKIYPSLKGELVNSIAFSKAGKMVVSATSDTKAKLVINKKELPYRRDIHYQFRELLAYQSQIWGAAMNGLAWFDGQDWQLISPQNSSFPSRSVSAIAVANSQDNRSSIWVGTFGQGLVRVSLVEKLSEGVFKMGDMPIKKGDVVRLRIRFERGTAIFKDTTGINSLIMLMKENPDINIELAGHTDKIGDPNLNYQLSQDRADAVMLTLIRNGIAASRIRTKAFGGTRPISHGRSEADRQKNRRVEMRIVE